MLKKLFLVFVFIHSILFAQKTDEIVFIKTSFGEMVFVLYDQTPKHKANFLKLAKEGFYNDLLFHRVIQNFMIQGGDPNSRNAKPGQMLGMGDVGYKIDAEFQPNLFHKKGALAAARDNNPQKASSGCQFYIVQGRKFTDEELNALSQQIRVNFPAEHREVYKMLGGSPHLDQNYTVFGEMLSGFEVLDKIASQPTNGAGIDRPIEDIKMQVSVKKMKRKKIEKTYKYKYPSKSRT
jgi:peptidyl-prolyl cis-trans isomerase B (cyclophilin B)